MNTKYKGGRGKKAPYQSVVVRIPLPLESKVESLVIDFISGINSDSDKTCNNLNNSSETTPKPKEQILSQLDEIRKTKKIGKDTINQILELIYGGDDCG